jgi:hypothetical protein
MHIYQVEISTCSQGEAPVRTKSEVTCSDGFSAILGALAILRPADTVSVFCKALPIKKVVPNQEKTA